MTHHSNIKIRYPVLSIGLSLIFLSFLMPAFAEEILLSNVLESTIHMSDTTASSGRSTYSGRSMNTEYVSPTSQLVGDSIDSITMKLKKVRSPSGIAEIGVFNSDLSVKKLFGIIDSSTLSNKYVDLTFTLPSGQFYQIQSGDRIGIKYTGGDIKNHISVMIDANSADPFDGSNSYHMYYTTSWTSTPSNDLYMILKQSGTQNVTSTVSINDITQTEGNSGTSNFVFTVSRTSNTDAISVNYSTADNTAAAPTDYTTIPTTPLNFAAGGPLTQTVSVSVNGDTAVETNETFYVNLSNCTGCVIGDSQGTGTITNDDFSNVQVAGWRSSQYGGIAQYGHDQSDPSYWIDVSQQMSSKFSNSSPGGILVLGYIDGSSGSATKTFLPFPKPSGTYPNVNFGLTDTIEPLLTAYDIAGLKVYLQVEPADADIPMLMDLVMNRYKHHSSVIGFGLDVEWYHEAQYPGWGRKLSDSEVNSWATKVKTYNPSYGLLVKHWDASYLSSARPSNVLFLTDGQQFDSLSSAISEYVSWVDTFAPSQIGFQIGYPADMTWWGTLSDPASEMINPVIQARPDANIDGVYWVDFSVLKEFPNN
jgi:hypothetical protein